MNDIKNVYKGYFDEALKSAAIGHNRRAPKNPKTGSEMLGQIGDTRTASAVADVLFRDGTGDGTKMIQKAINKAEGTAKVTVDTKNPAVGSQTFQALQDVAKDPKKKQKFLDELANQRSATEKPRNDYFRF